MEKKYYKHWAESHLGEGIAFMEVMNDEVTRQVEIYRNKAIWADKTSQSNDKFMVADQPASQIGLNSEDEITMAEFEEAWEKARS